MSVKVKKKKSAIKRIALLMAVLVFAAAAAGVLTAYRHIIDISSQEDSGQSAAAVPGNGISIDIPMGSGTAAIAKILHERGIIKYPFLFKLISRINGYDSKYMSGVHVVRDNTDYNSLKGYIELMKIMAGKPLDSTSVTVTIPEGLTYKQTVDLLTEKGIIDREKFNEAAQKTGFDYPFIEYIPQNRDPRLEGYLFPDTYNFHKEAGEKAVLEKLLDNFNKKFKPEYYDRARELNMTVDEIIILASIIEREAKVDSERATVAGVFYNRLNNSDPSLRRLQSCASIQYIYLNQEGTIKEIITEADTKIDNPYNTYQIEGLPPGPISSPGEASIKAALYPEETDYLFFVARGDGSHIFSKTFREHVNAMNSLN
jgi:UPF0755 protein